MKNYRSEQLAEHAQRLLKDDILNFAIMEAREYALSGLVDADASDMVEITKHQSLIRALEELQTTLQGFIIKDSMGRSYEEEEAPLTDHLN